MKPLEQSIIESLDGNAPALLPYMPYLLQDFQEIGADTETMFRLLQPHLHKPNPAILDLGCGKGGVAVYLASRLDAKVHAIDAMPDFIDSARAYAEQQGVADNIEFEVADIRARIHELGMYDVIVLGAIGEVLGKLETTLSILASHLHPGGFVLLDDAFVPDDSTYNYDRCLKQTDFYAHIQNAGFNIVEEVIFNDRKHESADEEMLHTMKRRAEELRQKEPEKSALFDLFIEQQTYETHMLKHALVTGTWLLKADK